MAKLAEQLVEEWLNRDGFFTIRGLRRGVHEIDLLAIRPRAGRTEARHVEVQVSFRPMSHIGKLTKEQQKTLGYRSATSAGKRPDAVLKSGIKDWVENKFLCERKKQMREYAFPGAQWDFVLVHAAVHVQRELEYMEEEGVRLIPFDSVVEKLCADPRDYSMGAGTDISEIIRYCAPARKLLRG